MSECWLQAEALLLVYSMLCHVNRLRIKRPECASDAEGGVAADCKEKEADGVENGATGRAAIAPELRCEGVAQHGANGRVVGEGRADRIGEPFGTTEAELADCASTRGELAGTAALLEVDGEADENDDTETEVALDELLGSWCFIGGRLGFAGSIAHVAVRATVALESGGKSSTG